MCLLDLLLLPFYHSRVICIYIIKESQISTASTSTTTAAYPCSCARATPNTKEDWNISRNQDTALFSHSFALLVTRSACFHPNVACFRALHLSTYGQSSCSSTPILNSKETAGLDSFLRNDRLYHHAIPFLPGDGNLSRSANDPTPRITSRPKSTIF